MEQCVTAEMLRQCKFARSCYQFHLDEMKRESEETDRKKKKSSKGRTGTDREEEEEEEKVIFYCN